MWKHDTIRPCEIGAPWFRHILREGNVLVDTMAKRTMSNKQDTFEDFAGTFQGAARDPYLPPSLV